MRAPGHVAALAQAQTEADRLELALARSTAEHAQVEADWRIASEQRDAAERSVVKLEEREQERTRRLQALGDPSSNDRAIAQAASAAGGCRTPGCRRPCQPKIDRGPHRPAATEPRSRRRDQRRRRGRTCRGEART